MHGFWFNWSIGLNGSWCARLETVQTQVEMTPLLAELSKSSKTAIIKPIHSNILSVTNQMMHWKRPLGLCVA